MSSFWAQDVGPQHLRSRVRASRRFLNWLALNHDIGYLTELEHVTGCLPCTRNALRGAHGNGIHGRSRGSRACREAQSLACVLGHMEGSAGKHHARVSDQASPQNVIYAWWILVQSWGALRRDNHRGIKPEDVQFLGGSTTAIQDGRHRSKCQFPTSLHQRLLFFSTKRDLVEKSLNGPQNRRRLTPETTFCQRRRPIAPAACVPN